MNPGGTGSPSRVISARFAPLPPSRSFWSLPPSVNSYTYFCINVRLTQRREGGTTTPRQQRRAAARARQERVGVRCGPGAAGPGNGLACSDVEAIPPAEVTAEPEQAPAGHRAGSAGRRAGPAGRHGEALDADHPIELLAQVSSLLLGVWTRGTRNPLEREPDPDAPTLESAAAHLLRRAGPGDLGAAGRDRRPVRRRGAAAAGTSRARHPGPRRCPAGCWSCAGQHPRRAGGGGRARAGRRGQHRWSGPSCRAGTSSPR